ncbi:MAG: hypothetical protein HKN13_09355 [Rhodothermales bacterium]|nr:hypothetical protein [Rhodothermales bacterium]
MRVQTILSSGQLATMRQRVHSESSVKLIYSKGNHYPLPMDTKLLNTLIEVPEQPPELLTGGSRGDEEANNAVKVHDYLGRLDRTQAADPRLWTTLTHTTFWDYCRRRWPVSGKDASYILEHWFEKPGGGLGALRRNAISRLWWAANLTVAPWETDQALSHFQSSDRFKFTRILLSQAQIFQDVLEREYGSNLRLRTLLLSSLEKYLPSVSNKDNLSKATSTQLLLVLKNRHVDALPLVEAETVIDSIVASAAQRQSAA